MDPVLFEQSIRENSIPPRPAVLEVIGRELQKDAPDLHTLERALRSDVAIAAGILKTANSPAFGLQRRVRSIMEALEVLGLRATAQAVACAALRVAFPNAQLERFWDASMKIAELGSWLVGIKRWPGLRSEDAYTFGLFRDCGIAVLIQRMSMYVDVLRNANTEAIRSFTDVEESVLPINHAHVGTMLAQSWWLPPEITDAIRRHHDVTTIMADSFAHVAHPASGALIAVAQTAEYILQQATGLSATSEWGKLGEACQNRLGIDDDELASLCCRGKETLAAL